MDSYLAIKLEPLTPVHVGTGEVLDPLSFVMHEVGGTPYLYYVDLPAWVESQEDPETLAREFGEKPLASVRSFIRSRLDVTRFGAPGVKVISRGIYEKYSSEIGARDSQNQLQIDPCMRNPIDNTVFIPGSSLKGAIRTAVIDLLDREFNLDLRSASGKGRRGLDNALKNVLRDKRYTGRRQDGVTDNAFKSLGLGDFGAAPGESRLVTALEVSTNPEKKPTPKRDCEVTFSRITGDESPIFGRLRLGNRSGMDKFLTIDNGNIRKTFDWQQLCDCVNAFYSKRYRDEREKFYNKTHLGVVGETLDAIEELLLNPGPGEMILRVGHYSHVECVTVKNNAPQTPRRQGRVMPHGTTRTLADGRYPFGWIKLSVIDERAYQEGVRQVAQRAQAMESGPTTSSAPEPMIRERSEDEAREERLETFKNQVNAVRVDRWPSEFPQLANQVLDSKSDDPEFAKAAAEAMVSLVYERKKQKSFKNKAWWGGLLTLAGRG